MDSGILTDFPLAVPDNDIAANLALFPATLFGAQARLAEQCSARLGFSGVSSFIATGAGGSVMSPGGLADSFDLRSAQPAQAQPRNATNPDAQK